jgi:3-hydroxyacyl-CoA dehydrogenase
LGKGVVRAKDTPNFIANRIGVFSMVAPSCTRPKRLA